MGLVTINGNAYLLMKAKPHGLVKFLCFAMIIPGFKKNIYIPKLTLKIIDTNLLNLPHYWKDFIKVKKKRYCYAIKCLLIQKKEKNYTN